VTDDDLVELTDLLERTPVVMREMLGRMTEDQLRWSPRQDEFTPLQHILSPEGSRAGSL